MKTDILIVGGGPTGLMMACLLKRSGINFRIIDKGSEQARESRALGIQARSLELFQNLGIVEEFLKRGQIASGAKMFLNGKQKMSLNFSDMGRRDTPYPYIFFLSQAETEKILIEDLLKWNVKVERQTTLRSLNQSREGVVVILENGQGQKETVEANYVIGCDGSHSQVRHELGLSFKGAAYEADFIMADAKVSWPYEHDKLIVFLDNGNIGVHFPLKNQALSRVLTIRQDDKKFPLTTETTTLPATLEEIEESFAKASHIKMKLFDPEWVARFRVHHRCVNQFRLGRVFVAGDAAHIHSPVGAQGMNTGLQDAANLAWKLAMVLKGTADEKILETYESERLPIARRLLEVTDRAFEFVITKNKAFISIRNLIIPIVTKFLMKFRRGRKFLFGFVSQLEIYYRPSLVVTVGAGRRMPNVVLDDGREIFDLIKGYRFHLLLFGEVKIDVELPEVIVHKIASVNFKREGMILVRPDGYIAYQVDEVSKEALDDMRKSFFKESALH